MSDSRSVPVDSCFHCGQPLVVDFSDRLQILGQPREFCCRGCHAVAEAIVAGGLEDYYKHRQAKAITADAVPEIVRKLSFYDHPDVQKSFIRQRGEAAEAALLLENIRCAACLWLNEQVLRGLDGVVDVELDYASQHARVWWNPDKIKLSEILEAIVNIGYVAHPYDPRRREELNAIHRKRSTERLIFAGVIGMMVMQFAIAGYIWGYADETGEISLWTRIGRWTSLFATTILLAYPGQEFFTGAWRDLKNRRLGMDVPIVLGLSIAYLGSVYTTITLQGEVYYDSIAMFIFLVLLARRIELRGRIQATDALDRVGRIVPRLAQRIRDKELEEVLVTDLRPGDRVLVSPGEVVPTDARIASGHSTFDESLLTGESTPVERKQGEAVISGACNIDQPVEVEVLRDTEDSTVAEIHRLLAGSQRDAPRYAVLAQRAATWFVGVVLVIAAITAAVWVTIDPAAAVHNIVAVLIVTCPCALALATPVAAAISAGRLADEGILQTRGDAMEVLAQCDTFVFDKTGTLTLGQLSLEHLAVVGSTNEEDARRIAAVLEEGSEHPIGRALRHGVELDGLSAVRLRNFPGQGVEAEVDGVVWRLGKPGFVDATSGSDKGLSERIADLENQDYLVVALGSDAGVQALYGLRDRTREGAPALMRRLRAQGVQRIHVLSGDSQRSVDRFSADLPVDNALGDQQPSQKLAYIRELQQQGARVAMIGDGINDAPTLAAANVSVSFAHASALAQTHSSVLIMGHSLQGLGTVRDYAQRTRKVIRQNLVWAASYNLLAVPAAAAGMVPPWGAAIGMSLSSLIVVVNALRLRR